MLPPSFNYELPRETFSPVSQALLLALWFAYLFPADLGSEPTALRMLPRDGPLSAILSPLDCF